MNILADVAYSYDYDPRTISPMCDMSQLGRGMGAVDSIDSYKFVYVGQVLSSSIQLFWWFLTRMRILIILSFTLCLLGTILSDYPLNVSKYPCQ